MRLHLAFILVSLHMFCLHGLSPEQGKNQWWCATYMQWCGVYESDYKSTISAGYGRVATPISQRGLKLNHIDFMYITCSDIIVHKKNNCFNVLFQKVLFSSLSFMSGIFYINDKTYNGIHKPLKLVLGVMVGVFLMCFQQWTTVLVVWLTTCTP